VEALVYFGIFSTTNFDISMKVNKLPNIKWGKKVHEKCRNIRHVLKKFQQAS